MNRTPLSPNTAGTTRAVPNRTRRRLAASTAGTATMADEPAKNGRLVTGNHVRKSASRIALDAACCAISAAAVRSATSELVCRDEDRLGSPLAWSGTERHDVVRAGLARLSSIARASIEVRRRETFRVTAVHRGERSLGFLTAALPLPEPGEAHGRTELPRLALLPPGDVDGALKAHFGFDTLVGRRGEKQLSLEAVKLRLLEAIVVLVDDGQRFVERRERFLDTPGLGMRLSQHAEIVGDTELGAGATKLAQAVEKERQRVVTAALQEQSRALVKRPQRVPELEPLVRGDRDLFLGGRLYFAAESRELVETRREIQGVSRC